MAAQHRGEILQEVVRKSGVNQARLARDLGIARSNLYRQYSVPNLDFVFIRRVGTALGYDITAHFKGMTAEPAVVAEPAATYQLDDLSACRQRLLLVHEQFAEKVRQYDELKVRYDALLAERGR